MGVVQVAAFRTSDGRVFTDAADAEAHEAETEFRRWCRENVCVGGEWSADMVAKAVLERWDVSRKGEGVASRVGAVWVGRGAEGDATAFHAEAVAYRAPGRRVGGGEGDTMALHAEADAIRVAGRRVGVLEISSTMDEFAENELANRVLAKVTREIEKGVVSRMPERLTPDVMSAVYAAVRTTLVELGVTLT